MKSRFFDLHNDAITRLSAKRFAQYLRRAAGDGLEGVLVSVWTTRMREPMSEIRKARQILDKLRTANEDGTRLLLHIEDVWFTNEENIDELISFGVASVGLTWNDDNALAGGANGDGDLTDLGKTIIGKLVDAGIVVDLAHLNRKSFYSVARLVRARGGRLFCSHTCFDYLRPHPRNLDYSQIQTIVDSGGLVGLTLVSGFLTTGWRAAMDDIYAHIKYFLDNFGTDNLGIGTDFYGTRSLPRGLGGYKSFGRFRRFLMAKGLSDTTVDKIFHKNSYEFFGN